MRKKLFILSCLMMFLVACTTNQNPSESTPDSEISESESSTEPKEYLDLEIDDMVAMREGYRDIRIRFPEGVSEPIEYQYDTRLITIDETNNRVIAKAEGYEVLVTATSENYQGTFTVKTDYIYYEPVLNAAPNKLADQKNRDLDNATIFIGDSFFDYGHYWKNFYEDIKPLEDNNVFLTGISSSSLKDWFYLSDYLLYNNIIAPRNIVIHLGSNDLWYNCGADEALFRLKELVSDLQYHYEDTEIYFISTENRTYAQVREHWNYRTHDSSKDVKLTLEESKGELLSFYNGAKNYCDETEKLTFIDSLSYFTDENNNCISSKFKDGCHPNNDEYKFYINALIANGMEGVKNAYTFSGEKEEDIAETRMTYKPNNEDLISSFYLTFELNIHAIWEEKGNMFIDFMFLDNGNRFLIWRFDQDDHFYTCGAFNGYNKTKNYSIDYNNTMGTVSAKVGILVTERHAYLLINDVLRVAFLNINNKTTLTTQSCWMDVDYIAPVVYNNENGKNIYKSVVDSMNEYETNSSTTQQYLSF